MSDSFLSDAGWLFLAAWSIVVAAVSIAAFGRDLLPSRAHINPRPNPHPADPVHPNNSAAR